MARTKYAATDVRKERTFRSGPYLQRLFGEAGPEPLMDAYLQRMICQRIQQARKEAGLTQEDAANLLGVTTRAYQNYERDRVPFRSLDRIAKLFNVSQEWLLRGDPPEVAHLEGAQAVLRRLESLEEHLAHVADVTARILELNEDSFDELRELLQGLGPGGQSRRRA